MEIWAAVIGLIGGVVIAGVGWQVDRERLKTEREGLKIDRDRLTLEVSKARDEAARVEAEAARREAERVRSWSMEDRDHTAGFLDAMSVALHGMDESFGNGFVPYREGHAFKALAQVFEERLRPHLGDAVGDQVRNVARVIDQAENQDQQLKSGGVGDPAALQSDLRRLMGDLDAISTKLRTQTA